MCHTGSRLTAQSGYGVQQHVLRDQTVPPVPSTALGMALLRAVADAVLWRGQVVFPQVGKQRLSPTSFLSPAARVR